MAGWSEERLTTYPIFCPEKKGQFSVLKKRWLKSHMWPTVTQKNTIKVNLLYSNPFAIGKIPSK